MNKYYKIYIVFVVFVISIFFLKLSFEYTGMQRAKELSIQYEAKALTDLILSFRQTYQEVFIKNRLNLNKSNIDFLPVKTVGRVSELFSKYNMQTKIHTVSDKPRNIINKANKRQMQSINKFNKNKKIDYLFEQRGTKYYYTKPLYVTNTCLKCHGKRENAPKIIQENYENAYNYKLGDLRGVIEIELEQTSMSNLLEISHNKRLIVAFLIVSLFLMVLFFYTKYFIKQKEKIQEKEKYESTVIEANNNAIIAIDWTGKITTFNKKAENMFGWSKDEMIGFRNLTKLMPSKYHKSYNKSSKKYLDTGISCGIINSYQELEGMRKDGTTFPLRISFGAKWKFKNVIVVASIIDLTQDRERDSIVMQQSKMAAMGEMLESIAHQWRQPLSVITTASSGIKMQKEFDILTDEILLTSCDSITNSAQHLSQTIDDFRSFFQEDKVKKHFNAKDIFHKTMALLTSKFKNIEIEIIENIDDVNTNGFGNELVQVFMNILNNAKDELEIQDIKRMIFVDIHQITDNIVIKIKDNAGGIPEDILPKIFDSNFTTKLERDGTGIGLYMTKKIIENSFKGTIEANNVSYRYNGKDYAGAEFAITIPLI